MIALVQARMTSRRLPGKVLRPLLGRPLLSHLLDSLRHCETLSGVVVVTSGEPTDDAIAEFCHAHGTTCFRGALHDVTARFIAAAQAFDAPSFVRLSGDSPLLDHRLVDRAVRLFHEQPCDLATNVLVRTFPRGQSVEVLSRAVLENAHESMAGDDREHVTAHFYRHPDRITIRDFRHTPGCGTLQMAVDTQADFDRVEACLAKLDQPLWTYDLDALILRY